MEQLNPDLMLFITGMKRCWYSDEDTEAGQKGKAVLWTSVGRNMKADVSSALTGVRDTICVQVGDTHSLLEDRTSSFCEKLQPQICHWSISSAPPPASTRLITSFKAQKPLGFSWREVRMEGSLKPEIYALTCVTTFILY